MKWVNLDLEYRRQLVIKATDRLGYNEQSVEKDWWVCAVLKGAFSSRYAGHLAFKGGTSLSKGYQIINRLSEDVDLALNKDSLGFSGQLSNTQIEKLRIRTVEFTKSEFMPELELRLKEMGIPSGDFSITEDRFPESKNKKADPIPIFVEYQSLFSPLPYLPSRVKIELFARTELEPVEPRIIRSLIDEAFQDTDIVEDPFEVPVVSPLRTFYEKIFLLHEYLCSPETQTGGRMSRHLYDVCMIYRTEFGIAALQNQELYRRIWQFRQRYVRRKNIDYRSHHPSTINFIPPVSVLENWESDYKLLCQSMLAGDYPNFGELIDCLRDVLQHLRSMELDEPGPE